MTLKAFKPVIFLLLASPLLAEVLVSFNTPVSSLLVPITWLWMVIGYGIPVLLIKKIRDRFHLGLSALLLMGLAYGILNEGILAHTLTQTAGAPVAAYVGYGTWLGINFSWATFILPWHALVSVCLPILLADFLFSPQTVNQPTANLKTTAYFGFFGLNIIYFLGLLAPIKKFPSPVIYIVIGWGLFALLLYYVIKNNWPPLKLLVLSLSFAMGFSVLTAVIKGGTTLILAGILLIFGLMILKKIPSNHEGARVPG